MKKLLITIVFGLIISQLLAQKSEPTPTELAQPIVEEGKLLYRLEKAAWNGTDIVLEKIEDRTKLGGYFAYPDGNKTICLFYSKAKKPKVLATVEFDSTFSITKSVLTMKKRAFTEVEKQVYHVRNKAYGLVTTDTLFKSYTNTNFNIIPIVDGEDTRVYVLTGPTQHGVIIFGNDYLIEFNAEGEIENYKKLHNNIIVDNYKRQEENTIGGMHTHNEETGDFITATDICTLMLYSEFPDWKTYTVVSKKYLNMWSCRDHNLIVLPQKGMFKREKE